MRVTIAVPSLDLLCSEADPKRTATFFAGPRSAVSSRHDVASYGRRAKLDPLLPISGSSKLGTLRLFLNYLLEHVSMQKEDLK